MLLDLRGSTRGGADDVARVAGLFLGEKQIGTERARGAEARPHSAKGRAAWTQPLTILLNGGTAGASPESDSSPIVPLGRSLFSNSVFPSGPSKRNWQSTLSCTTSARKNWPADAYSNHAAPKAKKK